ncbi:unnamed protein product [Parnassius mnemosyne]|uniref:HTH psq-type domain-containing protein n=1 Tax=Parnassius mnemosyne TaxID=213953 RepID=A0AAV1LD01_9NEOP
MPRKYIKKKVQKYSQDVEKAVQEVNQGISSIYGAAKKYSIPTTTLFDKVKLNHIQNIGRPQAIPFQQEEELANGLRIMAKWGFGLSRNETLDVVTDYVAKNNLKTPFHNNRPGPDWFLNLKKKTPIVN